MEASQFGPWGRKPTNEQQSRREIEAFFREEDELLKRRDFDATLSRIDFPVYMATDDAQGAVEAREVDREAYIAMMKPMYDGMPSGTEMKQQPQVTLLSDALAVVVVDVTMVEDGHVRTSKSHGLLVKRDGRWKWKSMVEAGWGGMGAPPGT